MKSRRQALIREIITGGVIETQEELTKALRERKIDVTQSTISRDIKEMMLVKVPAGGGKYRYAMPELPVASRGRAGMEKVIRDAVTEVAHNGAGVIVIKTLPGTANAVASYIDGAPWAGMLGTVAGDDTIIAVSMPDTAPGVVKKIAKMKNKEK